MRNLKDSPLRNFGFLAFPFSFALLLHLVLRRWWCLMHTAHVTVCARKWNPMQLSQCTPTLWTRTDFSETILAFSQRFPRKLKKKLVLNWNEASSPTTNFMYFHRASALSCKEKTWVLKVNQHSNQYINPLNTLYCHVYKCQEPDKANLYHTTPSQSKGCVLYSTVCVLCVQYTVLYRCVLYTVYCNKLHIVIKCVNIHYDLIYSLSIFHLFSIIILRVFKKSSKLGFKHSTL